MADLDFSLALNNAVQHYRELMNSANEPNHRLDPELARQFEFDASIVNNDQAASNKLATTIGEQGFEDLATGGPSVSVREGGLQSNALLSTVLRGPDNLHLLEIFEKWNEVDIDQQSHERGTPRYLSAYKEWHEAAVGALVSTLSTIRPKDTYVLRLAARMEEEAPSAPLARGDRYVKHNALNYYGENPREVEHARVPELAAQAYELLREKAQGGLPKLDIQWMQSHLGDDQLIAVAQKMSVDERVQLVTSSNVNHQSLFSWYADKMPAELQTAMQKQFTANTFDTFANSDTVDNWPQPMREQFAMLYAKKALDREQTIDVIGGSSFSNLGRWIENSFESHQLDRGATFKALAREIPAGRLGLMASEFDDSKNRQGLRQALASQPGKPDLKAFDKAVRNYSISERTSGEIEQASTRAGTQWGIGKVSDMHESDGDSDGVRIDQVSDALRPRLMPGDVITAIDGNQANTTWRFRDVMAALDGAKSVTLEVWQHREGDCRRQTVTILSDAAPQRK